MTDPASELFRAQRVLCVQPHYDDNDIGAGGTLAALAAAGATLEYLTVTDDLLGVLDPELSDADARHNLKAEQQKAGREIGVQRQHWFGYPDAGRYDEYELRSRIIQHIRASSPDYLFSVDPWLPNEAHRDHTRVGRAVAEASLLYGLPRLKTRPEIDEAYLPHRLLGVVFYMTRDPNIVIDITTTRETKHRALDAYRMQFTDDSLAQLHRRLDSMERYWARNDAFSHGEALKLLRTDQLHVGIAPDGSE
ncbi:MAG: PIG-L family deacetylase [Myxococcota bacterium]